MSKFRNVTWNNARFPAYIQIRRSIDLAELGDFGSIVDTPQDLPTSGATNRASTSGSASGTRQYVDLGVIGGSTSNVVDTQDMDSIATTASAHRVWSNMGAVSDVPFTTTLIGSLAYAPTATQMIIDGDVTSSISAGDTISTEDGDDEVTVSLSAWPKDATALASAASTYHGAGTVRVLNSDVRSSFPTGSIISANSDFSSNAEVTGTTYSSFSQNVTSWSSIGSRSIKFLVRESANTTVSSFRPKQGIVFTGSTANMTSTLSYNSSGSNPFAPANVTTGVKIPNSTSWSSYSINWEVSSGGWHFPNNSGSFNIQYPSGQQNYWTSRVAVGDLVAFDSMNRTKGDYWIVTGVNAGSNTTSIQVAAHPFNIPFYQPAQSSSTMYVLRSANTTTANFAWKWTTTNYQGSFVVDSAFNSWPNYSGANVTLYKSGTTSQTTYYTQIDYSGTADLFNSGDTIYGGLDETEITLNSGGTAYSNGDNVYKKT